MLRSLLFPFAALGAFAAAMLNCSDPSEPEAAVAADRGRFHQPSVTVQLQQSGTTNRLQAISPVSDDVAWASGGGGTYVVTTNGGRTWKAGVVPGGGDPGIPRRRGVQRPGGLPDVGGEWRGFANL